MIKHSFLLVAALLTLLLSTSAGRSDQFYNSGSPAGSLSFTIATNIHTHFGGLEGEFEGALGE